MKKLLSKLVKKYPNFITHALYWTVCKGSGLVKHDKDPRDFETGIFNWGAYQPKSQRKEIKTLGVKSQQYNNCQWYATTVQKEIDEKIVLSPRSICAWGLKNGLVSGDGLSNLPSGQKALKNWGIVSLNSLQENIQPWSNYANVDLNRFSAEAEKHKIQSYWSVTSRGDLLKLLDEDRAVTTGLAWFTGFNQGGGFGYPWIIEKVIGYSVGGHAVCIIGYDLNYHGKQVYIIQNSCGIGWGDAGKFYVTMDYLDRNNYGYFTNLDLPTDIAKFLVDYNGKNVKGSSSSIYLIKDGTKKGYPNWETYLAFNGKDKGFAVVDDELLNQVKEGDLMNIEETEYWDFLKDVSEANRLPALLEKLSQEL